MHGLVYTECPLCKGYTVVPLPQAAALSSVWSVPRGEVLA
jgi:hypothetical protein